LIERELVEAALGRLQCGGFTRSDPEVWHLVEEARVSSANAEAMAAAEGG
jgi:hypothetical protein